MKNFKKRHFVLGAMLIGSVLSVRVSRASSVAPTVFDFSFRSVSGDVSGAGTIDATYNSFDPNAPDYGTYTAVSGEINLPDPSVTPAYNGYQGTFDLEIPNPQSVYQNNGSPDGHTYYYSNTGYFYYDNQIFFPKTLNGAVLDVGGLVFANKADSSQEVNFYQDGNTIYYENDGKNEAVTLKVTPAISNAVPLPAAASAGFTTLGLFGLVFAARRKFQGRIASF